MEPDFGKSKVSALKKSDVKQFYNTLADERGLQVSTIDSVHTVLHQVLDMAVEDCYRQPFEEESLRSDFIDFCIAKITASSQPYAIRCYCMKLAYEQMKYYPELLEELRIALDMLEQEVLSPGMLSAKRQIMKKIKRSLGSFGK